MNPIDEPPVRQSDIIGCVRQRIEDAHREAASSSRPFITVTYAQSLDGSIALAQGETLKLSNDHSLQLTHQVRAIHDSILVGINTVVRDNPRLTVRLAEGRNPQPIVVDGTLRFPMDSHLLREPCVPPIIFTSVDACSRKEQQLQAAGATVIRIRQTAAGLLDLRLLLEQLKQQHGLRSVMVEGGASIITNLLTLGLADQYLITIAPRLVGGLRAIHAQVDTVHDRLANLQNLHYQWLAGDLILRGDVLPVAGASRHAPSAAVGHALAEPAVRAAREAHDGSTSQR